MWNSKYKTMVHLCLIINWLFHQDCRWYFLKSALFFKFLSSFIITLKQWNILTLWNKQYKYRSLLEPNFVQICGICNQDFQHLSSATIFSTCFMLCRSVRHIGEFHFLSWMRASLLTPWMHTQSECAGGCSCREMIETEGFKFISGTGTIPPRLGACEPTAPY